MSDASTGDTAASEAEPTERVHSVVSRVLSLSIFFVGIGAFAAVGLAMNRLGLLDAYGTTYFAVGVVVGVVGVLLWLLTR